MVGAAIRAGAHSSVDGQAACSTYRLLVTTAAEVSSQLVSMASTTRWRRDAASRQRRRRTAMAAGLASGTRILLCR